MKMWGFILVIFIFALVSAAINEEGLLTVHEVQDFNADNITTSNSKIKEILNEESEQSEDSFTSSLPGVEMFSIISKMFSVLIEALGITVLIYPTLLIYGVPASLALIFQTVISFMESIFIFQVWRRFKIEN